MRFSKLFLTAASAAIVLGGTASAALYPGFWEFRTNNDRSKAMDMTYSRIADGATLQIWSANGSNAQLFGLAQNGDYWSIINANSMKNIRCPFVVENVQQAIQMRGPAEQTADCRARYYRFKIEEVSGLDTIKIQCDSVELPVLTNFVNTGEAAGRSWKYTTSDPGTGWETPAFDDAAWSTGNSPFGSTGTPGISPNTQWSSSDIWLRKTITQGDISWPILDSLRWFHDESIEVYINGILAASATGYTTAYENIQLLDTAVHALVPNSTNVIAVHCHQSVGGQGVDIGFWATVYKPQAVNMYLHTTSPVVDGNPVYIHTASGTNSKWQAIDRNVAWVYENANYTGQKVGLAPGDYTTADLNALGIADNSISSIKMSSGYEVTFFDEDNFIGEVEQSGAAGLNRTVDQPDLSTVTQDLSSGNWDNRISSIKVNINAPTTTAANGQTFTLWSEQDFNGNYDNTNWQKAGASPASRTPLGATSVYDASCAVVEDGMLKLLVKYDSATSTYKSGMLEMINKDITFGVVEARIKTSPKVGGYVTSLGAFKWDLGGRYEELLITLDGNDHDLFSGDLLECKQSPTDPQTLYTTSQSCFGANKVSGTLVNGVAPDYDDPYWAHDIGWHTYRIEFTSSGVNWFVDGVLFKQIDANTHYYDSNGNDLINDPNGCAASLGYYNGFIPNQAKRVLIENWLPTSALSAEEWDNGEMPFITLVDYIRVYK